MQWKSLGVYAPVTVIPGTHLVPLNNWAAMIFLNAILRSHKRNLGLAPPDLCH